MVFVDEDDEKSDEPILELSVIKEEIENLPLKYREIMTMRLIDEISYKNIASYLDIPCNTVKTRIKKGKEILQEGLLNRIEEKKEFI